MIRVIRQDGVEILLNTDIIETIEEAEEKTSVIKLTTGEEIHAKSPAWDISQKAKAYIRGIMQENKEYDRPKDKSKDKEKDKEKEKERPRERDNVKDKKEKPRDKDKDRYRDRDKSKDRDRDRDKKGRDYVKGRR